MINQLVLEEEKMIKNIRNLFSLKKENKAIKSRMIRDIRELFEKKTIITKQTSKIR